MPQIVPHDNKFRMYTQKQEASDCNSYDSCTFYLLIAVTQQLFLSELFNQSNTHPDFYICPGKSEWLHLWFSDKLIIAHPPLEIQSNFLLSTIIIIVSRMAYQNFQVTFVPADTGHRSRQLYCALHLKPIYKLE